MGIRDEAEKWANVRDYDIRSDCAEDARTLAKRVLILLDALEKAAEWPDSDMHEIAKEAIKQAEEV